MGAWGFGLFENDSDLDRISELADECGLTKVEEEAQQKAKAEHNKAKKATDKVNADASDQKEGAGEDAEDDFDQYSVMYSLFADYCSDTKAVREFLDGGALDKMVEKHKGYKLMLIGICAMSLGCTLSEDFLKTLRKQFPRCKLGGKARNQVGKALFGPNGFENGKEYDFESKGLMQTASDAMDGKDAEWEDEVY